MKSRIHQKGNVVTIIVIIVLVIAVLGLLGFVFWQNFLNKSATKTADTTQAAQDDTKTSSTKTLVIKDWGVEGDYSDSSVDFVTTMNSAFGTDMVDLTDSKLADVPGCTDKAATGYISRLTGDQQIDPDGTTASQSYDTFVKTKDDNKGYFAMAHVGDYYYMFTPPQSNCSVDSSVTAIQNAASLAAASAVKSLHAVN